MEFRGFEIGLPTGATAFSFPKNPAGSSADTSPILKLRDAFFSGLTQPSHGDAQLLTSSGVYRQ